MKAPIFSVNFADFVVDVTRPTAAASHPPKVTVTLHADTFHWSD